MDPSPRSEITTPEVLGDDETAELSLRPQRLAEFIGQPKTKEALKIAIDAALNRREPLDHVLLYGPPGLGKTTLGLLIAREMNVNIKLTSGPVLEKPGPGGTPRRCGSTRWPIPRFQPPTTH